MTEAAADTRSETVNDGAIRVRRALVSVSDKTGVADFARGLAGLGVEILSTGGTAAALREAGLEVTDVSEFTGQEEILGGRVKTLHPRLHAALLARRDDPEHMATLEREAIVPIDLVCVNLYPFEQTVADPGRRARRRGREHRHRRADDDPRRRQEPQRGRRRGQARVLRRGAGRAGGVGRRGLGDDPALARQRGLRPDRALRRRDQPLVLGRVRGLPRTPRRRLREGARPLLRREPAPAGGALLRSRRAQPRALARRQAARPRPLLQQRARPRLGPAPGRRLRAARLHDRQAQQPLRGGDRQGRARGLREGAGLRPDVGLRRRHRLQPAGLRGARQTAARELRRGADRARLRARRPRRAAAEGGDPHPLRGGAPPARTRRTRRQTGDGRPADPGPRRRPRAARDHGGRHQVAAERSAVGRHVLRLDRRPPRPLQRDRDRQGRRHARHRRRPDEPRRLGPPRGREVPRRPRRGRRRPARRLRRRLRRLLPLRRRPRAGDRRPAPPP